MKTPLQAIADLGCPTDSMIDAMRYFGEREDLTEAEYVKAIHEIVGSTDDHVPMDHFNAKVLFKYIVQETIRAYGTGLIPDMDRMFVYCLEKADTFIENNPWSETLFNINHGLQDREEVDPETGVIVTAKPKGAKKDVTERIFNDLKSKGASRQDIIDAFVQQTGMSKAGATTYFHTLKKELGFKESTTEKKSAKPESKQEIAERLYQGSETKDKSEMIALFVEKLETSKLGAQTYYYACKKKFNAISDINKVT